MMYRYYFTFFVCLIFLSCNKDKPKITEPKPLQEVMKNDTVYCDFSKTILKNKTSMYNLEYQSVISTNAGNTKIRYKMADINYLCTSKKINIALLKEKDTIYDVHVDMKLIDKELKDFYMRYNDGIKKNKLPELESMNYNQNFKLDSIKLAITRTNHLYYTCYLYNYKEHESYSVKLGINYLDYKKGEFLINQLEKL